jgi:hypothetical protein
MKKLTILAIAALVLAMVLVPAAYTAMPTPQLLDFVDIGDPVDEIGYDISEPDWGPPEPFTNGGGWGGIGAGMRCRVVWHAAGDTSGRSATLTLDTTANSITAKARHIVLRVLDGFADDSFNVYVKNPGGDWALVYSYSDSSDSEVWKVHDIYSFPAGKGQGTTIEIMIEATGAAWSGFGKYGQLAVDWVEVWGF